MTAPIAARPPRIPMDQAFYEIAAHVRDRLNSLGIHWGDQAEQAAVCTLLIQAGKCGWLLPWNSPGPIAPARESSSRSAIPINRPSEPGKIDARDAAASRRDSQHPPEFRTHQQAPSAKSESVIVRAFREIEKELDPDVYRTGKRKKDDNSSQIDLCRPKQNVPLRG